jgi:hypothetical protein
MKSAAIWLTTTLFLASCAKVNDTAMNLLSSSSPAVAVVNGTLLTGKAVLFTDRTGTLDLQSNKEPVLKCMGRLRYTATQSGQVRLQCNDGTDAPMTFSTISETSGHGSGQTARGTAAFTYGLDMAEAAAYLKLPVDKPVDASPETGAQPR